MIERQMIKEINKWMSARKYIILKGARQVGKTTILQMLEKNALNPKAFLICDNIDFGSRINTPSDLIFYIKEFHGFDEEKKFFLFLDEFQYIKNAGLFLKNIYDKYPNIKIIASGSSSLEITKNSEFLTGRSIDFHVSPLSFQEVLSYFLQKEIEKKCLSDFEEIVRFYKFYKKELDKVFLEYLSYGGLPQIVIEREKEKKKTLLYEYTKKYIEKDIVNFLEIENISGFNNLLKLSADNIGSLLNIHSVSNMLNMANKTVNKYFDILEGTFVCRRVKPFYKNLRSEISKSPKIFFNDLGIRNSLLKINDFLTEKIDLGAETENFIFNELSNRFAEDQIHFYRTIGGSEIDFLIERNIREYFLIEVKYRANIKKNIAFKNFSEKYKDIKLNKIIITRDILKKDENVFYIPASIFGLIDLEKI